jgi:hypothetical protein
LSVRPIDRDAREAGDASDNRLVESLRPRDTASGTSGQRCRDNRETTPYRPGGRSATVPAQDAANAAACITNASRSRSAAPRCAHPWLCRTAGRGVRTSGASPIRIRSRPGAPIALGPAPLQFRPSQTPNYSSGIVGRARANNLTLAPDTHKLSRPSSRHPGPQPDGPGLPSLGPTASRPHRARTFPNSPSSSSVMAATSGPSRDGPSHPSPQLT